MAVLNKNSRIWWGLPYAVAMFLFVLLTTAILLLNGGHFVYSLDDPYIHLTMSEHIAAFHYGLNIEEYSSPSSSILWPFLLAPFSPFSIHRYVPFVLAIIATFCSISILISLLKKEGIGAREGGYCLGSLLVSILIIALNLVGLAFTGMEHSFQVLCALALLAGLLELLRNDQVRFWFVLALIVGPLIRYENLAMSAPAMAIMVARKRYRLFFLTLGALSLGIAGFSWFLVQHGLPFLPSSVLTKFDFRQQESDISTNILSTPVTFLVEAPQAIVLAVSVIVLLGTSLAYLGKRPDYSMAALFSGLAILGHVLAGSYGWFYRYEVYIYALMTATLLVVFSQKLFAMLERAGTTLSTAILVLCLVPLCFPLVMGTVLTPLAANTIYEQQYQMRRFACDYLRAPVAVNDIGYVSYRNPTYVLDLMGLGLDEARRRRAANDLQYVGDLVKRKEVPVAMVYDRWMKPYIPKDWKKIAVLERRRHNYGAAENSVIFYDTMEGDSGVLKRALNEFSGELPPGVWLTGPASGEQ